MNLRESFQRRTISSVSLSQQYKQQYSQKSKLSELAYTLMTFSNLTRLKISQKNGIKKKLTKLTKVFEKNCTCYLTGDTVKKIWSGNCNFMEYGNPISAIFQKVIQISRQELLSCDKSRNALKLLGV